MFEQLGTLCRSIIAAVQTIQQRIEVVAIHIRVWTLRISDPDHRTGFPHDLEGGLDERRVGTVSDDQFCVCVAEDDDRAATDALLPKGSRARRRLSCRVANGVV